MDEVKPPRPTPETWLDAIAKGEADYAAARTHDLDEVLGAFEAEDRSEQAGDAKARGPAAAE